MLNKDRHLFVNCFILLHGCLVGLLVIFTTRLLKVWNTMPKIDTLDKKKAKIAKSYAAYCGDKICIIYLSFKKGPDINT